MIAPWLFYIGVFAAIALDIGAAWIVTCFSDACWAWRAAG